MAKYRNKPIIVEAVQWFKRPKKGWKDEIVDFYRHPNVPGRSNCGRCGRIMHDHGWIDNLEGGRTVCPGDWIITNF